MDISPITLVGHFVRLEPMTLAHESALIAAAADGEVWNTDVTIIPRADGMRDYIQFALHGLAQGKQLPFVIVRKSGTSIRRASDGAGEVRPVVDAQDPPATPEIVGTTRFYE